MDSEDNSVNASLVSFSSTPRKFEHSDTPIPLLVYNQVKGKFEMNDDGLEFLRSVAPPIAIIGVAGMYRTGKSYLLNRVLLNRQSGFGVGPTVNPCTKGLWL